MVSTMCSADRGTKERVSELMTVFVWKLRRRARVMRRRMQRARGSGR